MGPHRFHDEWAKMDSLDEILVGGKINIYKIKTFPLPGFEPGTLE
jgi:hypothetical protein